MTILDWSTSDHWNGGGRLPCRICGEPASLVDDDGRPVHKVCVERHVASGQASAWDEFAPPLGERLKNDLCNMVETVASTDDRSRQTDLGPSEIPDPCTACLARKILGLKPDHGGDVWCRTIGTAVHHWLEAAAAHINVATDDGRWYPEARVHPDPRLLPSGGSADLFDSETKTVIDHKVIGRDRLAKFKANGPGDRYRAQVHIYGKGYTLRGHDVEHVAIAFWHRGGMLRDLYVWTEPYDVDVADAALARYETLRDLVLSVGESVIEHLPTDPDCYDCPRYAASAVAVEEPDTVRHPNPPAT